MNNFDDFIEQIIKDKGLDKEDPEIVAQIKSDLGDSIEERIDAMIILNMPEDKSEEFDALLDAGDQPKITAYIRKVIPDIEEKVALELGEFRAYYLG